MALPEGNRTRWGGDFICWSQEMWYLSMLGVTVFSKQQGAVKRPDITSIIFPILYPWFDEKPNAFSRLQVEVSLSKWRSYIYYPKVPAKYMFAFILLARVCSQLCSFCKKFYLFTWEADRQRRGERSPIHWLTPQVVTMKGPGQAKARVQELYLVCMWMSGIWVLGPPSTAFSGTLTKSWMRSGRARTWTCASRWDAHVVSSGLVHCATVPASHLSSYMW